MRLTWSTEVADLSLSLSALNPTRLSLQSPILRISCQSGQFPLSNPHPPPPPQIQTQQIKRKKPNKG